MALEGLQLGQYRLLRLLGSGGMGEVYLAEDARINQQVVIKASRIEATPYPNNSNTQDVVRLFQREAKAIASLDHPHILSLFSYGEENVNGMTVIYIVMPYRREGSFINWLLRRGDNELLSVQDVAYFISQAADALQYAHENQIVHQDVKPSNFLYSNEQRAF
ncbi:MAG: serine/threonine protein kinase [Ktedonobacteraceae bacterium]